MRLSHLVRPLMKYRRIGSEDPEITNLTADSRQVRPGSLFVAVRGYTIDGHAFAEDAVRNGAIALLVDTEMPKLSVPQIVVSDTRKASGILATRFYGDPSSRLSVIGVTGTNGKTTVTHLIEAILLDHGAKTGLLGTVGKRIGDQTGEMVNTTPEAIDLQAALAEMVGAGCDYGILEVSSIALELSRVAGTRFHIGVFTNLTQDHLDFHGTMENYRRAKGKLFSRLGNTYGEDRRSTAYAVLNADDDATAFYRRETVMECVTYAIREPADVRATDIRVEADGIRFHVTTFAGETDVKLRLMGRFNVYNALAALSVGLVEGVDLSRIAHALEAVSGIPGRLERIELGQPFTVLIDFAHTPDGLWNVLTTVREWVDGRVITVMGSGGDRDRGKRPKMAQIAVDGSDVAILTSDNPRTEDPEQILDDMERGVVGTFGRYERVTDRREAIWRAVAIAEPGDVVLIAGKGHERYQIIGRSQILFDDREEAAAAIRARFPERWT